MALFDWLDEQTSRQGMNYTDLAKHLRISRPYLYALRKQQRDPRNMDRDLIERIASFLGRPVISVYMGAGILGNRDFYPPGDKRLTQECQRAMDFIRADPEWSSLVPSQPQLSLAMQLFTVRAYEKATGRTLVKGAYDGPGGADLDEADWS